MEGLVTHILLFPIPARQGKQNIAATRRVRSLLDNLPQSGSLKRTNLIVAEPNTHSHIVDTEVDGYVCREIGYRQSNPLSWLQFWTRSAAFIWDQRDRKGRNLVYAYTDPDLFLLPILIFARWIGYRIIFDIVEDNSLVQGTRTSALGWLRRKTGVFLMRYIGMFAHGVIVISQHLNQKFQQITPNTPLFFAPTTVDLNKIQPFQSKRAHKQQVIFYGGTFGQKDGLPLLLRAFKEILKTHPTAVLRLTGSGSKPDMDTFWCEVNQLALTHYIEFLGFLPSEDYFRQLKNSDIFCMVRTNSAFANAGFPYKLCEMLATGNLVIATNVSDIATYLTHKVNALVIEPDNLSALIESLRWALDNPAERQQIGTRGRTVALQTFNGQLVAAKLNTFLQQLP